MSTPAFMDADRALAVAHREDDQPCGCDECMSYGAEDAGFDWYKVTPARRIVLRVLDSGDDRLAAIAAAFREHEVASAVGSEHGDSHRYRIECEVCGQRGQVVLSVEPQRASGSQDPA